MNNVKPRFNAQMEGDKLPDIRRLDNGRYYTMWRGFCGSEWPIPGNREQAGKAMDIALSARATLARIVAENRRK